MNKIKEARLKTGLSRAETAKLLKMPYRTLENWEQDKRYPAPYIERLIIKEMEQYFVKKGVEKEVVTNYWGVDIDFDIAVNYMDDDLRETLHRELAPCTEQEFFNAYCKAHEEKYGEEWELAKENPCY